MVKASELDNIVLIGLDGLRPDTISQSLTPNLQSVVDTGCYLSSHRAVFPSETRVNLASLSTGARTTEHGVVANTFLHTVDGFSAIQSTATAEWLATLADTKGGAPFDIDWLGSILARNDRSFAVMTSGSAGSMRLLSWGADKFGQFVFNPFVPELATPSDLASEIVARYGVLGDEAPPRRRGIRYLTDVFLNYAWPRRKPAASLIWYGEPDKSQHVHGPGSDAAVEAMRALDHEIGRLLAWREEQPNADRIGLILISDHGQVSIKENISIAETLRGGGFRVGEGLVDDAELAITRRSTTIGLWARRNDEKLLAEACALLSEQKWFAMAFSRGEPGEDYGNVPGTFSHEAVFAEHPAAPPLRIVLSGDYEANGNGLSGRCYFDGHLGVGCGTHGGLHAKELEAFGVFHGGPFRTGYRSAVHSSISDILPTILHCLGVEAPDGIGGRILHEAFDNSVAPSDSVMSRLGVTAGGRERCIDRAFVGTHGYIDRGWVRGE